MVDQGMVTSCNDPVLCCYITFGSLVFCSTVLLQRPACNVVSALQKAGRNLHHSHFAESGQEMQGKCDTYTHCSEGHKKHCEVFINTKFLDHYSYWIHNNIVDNGR